MSSVFISNGCLVSSRHPSLPRRAKWKHNENQINSTNFSAVFQTSSVFCPFMKYRFNFSISPDGIDDLWFCFALFCFVHSLAFASNILLVDMNSLSCKMFIFRLSRAQVRWQWMAALIPVNTFGVNAWPFSVFTSIRWTYSFEIHCNFSFLAPFLELFYFPLSCSLGVFRLSFLLNFIELLVVLIRVLTSKKMKIWDFFHFKYNL